MPHNNYFSASTDSESDILLSQSVPLSMLNELDAVSDDKYSNLVSEAEVLRVLSEILDGYPSISNHYVIRINHYDIIDTILTLCEVKGEDVKLAISNVISQRALEPWSILKEDLTKRVKLSVKSLEIIKMFITMRGSPKYVLNEIINNFSPFPRSMVAKAEHAARYLLALVDMLENFKVPLAKIVVDCGLHFTPEFNTGLLFQAQATCASSHVTVAYGGRYDNYIKANTNENNIKGIGVTVILEKIYALVDNIRV